MADVLRNAAQCCALRSLVPTLQEAWTVTKRNPLHCDASSRSEHRRWFSRTPDVHCAILDYARLGPNYDRETRWIDAVREAAIARLALLPGEIVGDIGCGTGFCLPALSQAVGFGGKVIGIEPTSAMLAQARTRTAGFSNVVLVQSPAETARLGLAPDAMLFSFAHDVLQSHAALENILAQAKVGTRIVAVGSKLFPWWLAPRNLWFLAGERNYVTTYRGFFRPWRLLAQHLDEFSVISLPPGNKYMATGRLHSLPSILQVD